MLERFDKVTYFGDSLSDDGNYFEILYGYEAPGFQGAVYPGTTFQLGPWGAMTNDRAHSTYLAELTGARTDNYAVVGATIVGSPILDPAN